jgi:predicted RNA-binding Zn ribbon-like protein
MGARDEDVPSIREIAELTARLRRLSVAGRDADPAERAVFLADKAALIARIEAANHRADTADDVRIDTAAGFSELLEDERSATVTDQDDDGEEWSR